MGQSRREVQGTETCLYFQRKIKPTATIIIIIEGIKVMPRLTDRGRWEEIINEIISGINRWGRLKT